ncbi:WD40-repeat-containing domain protein [Bombardia bombarda]|uniref:WD40-repeat-containing domain protein n=1 Tax=Bombardia bombarda TaxID=252184 RepID=A0AA40BVC8_9PEZI|nr:WD40-repeat-containing domain protein [Bombardia bombarda]
MSIDIERILAAAPTTTRGQPTQLSCDPKGERIAYASGKSIYIRSIDKPSQALQYTGHTTTTTVARFSPSGFYIASGDVSGKVRVWDAVGAVNTKGEYSIIAGRINDIGWDGDSARLIAVGDGRDRFGHCFTADSGNSVGEVSGHSKVVNAVAVRQQRPLRAATVSDDSTMCFLHGAPFKFNSKADNVHRGFVMGTAFSPDGSLLVTVGADRRIQLYDGKTGEPTRQIGDGVHTGSIFAVSWAGDSRRFATASADQTVRVWDVAEGKCVQSWRIGGDEGVVSVPDQQVGVVWPHGRSDGLIISLGLSGDLHYLTLGKDKPAKTVQGHNKSITALGASSGESVLTGSFDGRVCSWDISTGEGRVVDGQGHSNQVTQFATAAAGRIYSVGWDDTLRTIDEAANTFTGSSVKLDGQPKATGAYDGRVFVALSGQDKKSIAVYKEDKLVDTVALGFEPVSIASYGSAVVVGGNGNSAAVYDFSSSSNKLSKTSKKSLDDSTAEISSLSFSPDGKLLAAGNGSGKIFVYDTSSWEMVQNRWSAHTSRIYTMAWNSAGTHLVSGGLDTHLFVWSVSKPGKRVTAPNAHKDGVFGVAWVEGDTKVASAGRDAAVKIWTVKGLQ